MKSIQQIFEAKSSSKPQFTVDIKTLQLMLNSEAAFYKNFKKFSDDEVKVMFKLFKQKLDDVVDSNDEQITFNGYSMFNLYYAMNYLSDHWGAELANRFIFIKSSIEVFDFSGIYADLRTKGYAFQEINALKPPYKQWYHMSLILNYKLDASKIPDTGIGKPLKWGRILTLLNKRVPSSVSQEVIDKYNKYGAQKGYKSSTIIKKNDFLQLAEDSYHFTNELYKETGNEKFLDGGLVYHQVFDDLCGFYKYGTYREQPQVFSYLTPVLYEMYKSGKIESFELELIDKYEMNKRVMF